MRIIGLDFGSKTVGVAMSDELLITAQGVEIVRRKSPTKLRQTLARIEEIIAEYGAERIVLGYPKNMNNTEGERCAKTLEFKEMLERRTSLPVILWDERLTTVSADQVMMESGIRREDRKKYVDRIAAEFILGFFEESDRIGVFMEKIKFTDPDTGECLEFYVLEQTRINNRDYLLVTVDEDGDSDAFVLKDLSEDTEKEAVYEIVEEEAELEAIAKVFSEMLEDVDIEL